MVALITLGLLVSYSGTVLSAAIVKDIQQYDSLSNPAQITKQDMYLFVGEPPEWSAVLCHDNGKVEMNASSRDTCFFKVHQMNHLAPFKFERYHEPNPRSLTYYWTQTLQWRQRLMQMMILMPATKNPIDCEAWMEKVGLSQVMDLEDFATWAQTSRDPQYSVVKFTLERESHHGHQSKIINSGSSTLNPSVKSRLPYTRRHSEYPVSSLDPRSDKEPSPSLSIFPRDSFNFDGMKYALPRVKRVLDGKGTSHSGPIEGRDQSLISHISDVSSSESLNKDTKIVQTSPRRSAGRFRDSKDIVPKAEPSLQTLSRDNSSGRSHTLDSVIYLERTTVPSIVHSSNPVIQNKDKNTK